MPFDPKGNCRTVVISRSPFSEITGTLDTSNVPTQGKQSIHWTTLEKIQLSENVTRTHGCLMSRFCSLFWNVYSLWNLDSFKILFTEIWDEVGFQYIRRSNAGVTSLKSYIEPNPWALSHNIQHFLSGSRPSLFSVIKRERLVILLLNDLGLKVCSAKLENSEKN